MLKVMATTVISALIMIIFAALLGHKLINKEVFLRSPATGGELFIKCIGAFDEGNPAYVYKLDTTNLILSIVFVETIFMPIIIANDYLRCPLALK